MKVKSILFLFFSLAIPSLHAQRIKGSDTVLPVAQQTAERFMNKHADARVTVTGGGTGVGFPEPWGRPRSRWRTDSIFSGFRRPLPSAPA